MQGHRRVGDGSATKGKKRGGSKVQKPPPDPLVLKFQAPADRALTKPAAHPKTTSTSDISRPSNIMESSEFRCYCGKAYQVLNSLQRHSRTCPASVPGDWRFLLELFASLGPWPIPGDLLHRAFSPFRTWNENGNLCFDKIFQPPAIFESEQRLQNVIQMAINIGAVQVRMSADLPKGMTEPSWLACRDFVLPESARKFVRSRLALNQEADDRELTAVRLLIHGFPRPDLDERYCPYTSIFLALCTSNSFF